MKNILRGKILSFLAEIYPRDVEKVTVIGVFFEYHHVGDIEKALEYLAGRKYLEKIERPHPYKPHEKIVLFRITPDGIDITEGTKEDPGITIVPEP